MKPVGAFLTMILGLLTPQMTSAQEGLFSERPTVADRDVAPELGVVRARAVSIELRGLPGSDGTSAVPPAGHTLRLNLFDEAVLVAQMTRAARLDKGLAWSGRLAGDPLSSVEIVVYDGIVSGTVNGEAGSFRIGWDGTGQVIQEMDYDQFPEDHDCALDRHDTPPETEADPGSQVAQDDGTFVDVMVVYTPAARAAQGGTAAMLSLINLAISETNTAYANSAVVQRVRLVHTAEVSLTESGISTDLNRLTSTNDNHIDNVHTLRNTSKADLVSLFGTGYTSSGACGVAWLYPSVAANGFSVVDRTCATGYYSFGHEMGHNMGLNHAHEDPVGTGAYSYSYGHKDPGDLFRTTMAYNCNYGNPTRSSCTRRPYYSNPSVSYGGRPTGVGNYADNARSLNNTRVAVSNWRVGDVAAVQVTSPNGGQAWPVGSIWPISWTATALNASASIRLYYTNGSTTTTIATGVSRTRRSYSWTVPNDIGSSWKVRVCSWVGGSCEADDVSDGSFSITPAASLPPPRSDFNGDGRFDILWQNRKDDYLSAWYMNGINRTAGVMLNPARVGVPNWEIVGVGDFNSDGKSDILWQNKRDDYLSVWYMDGINRIAGVLLNPARVGAPNWEIVGVGDFNADGKSDILWQNEKDDYLSVWYMDGINRTAGVSLNPARVGVPNWEIGVGDFNADGKSDILWQNEKDDYLSVWYMDGINRTAGTLLNPARVGAANWEIVGVGDFNFDGRSDILWQNKSDDYLSVWYMDGINRAGGVYLNPARVGVPNWQVVQH